MRCQQVRGYLSSYMDGVATPREASFVETHLHNCPDCTRELAELRKITALLSQAEELEVPEGFIDELQMRLLRDKVEPLPVKELVFKTRKPGWIAALIAGAALMAGIYASPYIVEAVQKILQVLFP